MTSNLLEDLAVLNDSPRGVAQGEPHVAGVGSHHTQTMPARYADVLFNEFKQVPCQIGEHGVRQVLAGFGKSLRAHAAHQLGLVTQHRKEAIQFSLHCGAVAAEKPADECRKIQHAPSAEMPAITKMAGAKSGRMEARDEPVQNSVQPVLCRGQF